MLHEAQTSGGTAVSEARSREAAACSRGHSGSHVIDEDVQSYDVNSPAAARSQISTAVSFEDANPAGSTAAGVHSLNGDSAHSAAENEGENSSMPDIHPTTSLLSTAVRTGSPQPRMPGSPSLERAMSLISYAEADQAALSARGGTPASTYAQGIVNPTPRTRPSSPQASQARQQMSSGSEGGMPSRASLRHGADRPLHARANMLEGQASLSFSDMHRQGRVWQGDPQAGYALPVDQSVDAVHRGDSQEAGEQTGVSMEGPLDPRGLQSWRHAESHPAEQQLAGIAFPPGQGGHATDQMRQQAVANMLSAVASLREPAAANAARQSTLQPAFTLQPQASSIQSRQRLRAEALQNPGSVQTLPAFHAIPELASQARGRSPLGPHVTSQQHPALQPDNAAGVQAETGQTTGLNAGALNESPSPRQDPAAQQARLGAVLGISKDASPGQPGSAVGQVQGALGRPVRRASSENAPQEEPGSRQEASHPENSVLATIVDAEMGDDVNQDDTRSLQPSPSHDSRPANDGNNAAPEPSVQASVHPTASANGGEAAAIATEDAFASPPDAAEQEPANQEIHSGFISPHSTRNLRDLSPQASMPKASRANRMPADQTGLNHGAGGNNHNSRLANRPSHSGNFPAHAIVGNGLEFAAGHETAVQSQPLAQAGAAAKPKPALTVVMQEGLVGPRIGGEDGAASPLGSIPQHRVRDKHSNGSNPDAPSNAASPAQSRQTAKRKRASQGDNLSGASNM